MPVAGPRLPPPQQRAAHLDDMSLDHDTTLSALASGKQLHHDPELDRLLRELAAIGASDEAENAPSENYRFAEAATGTEAAFSQQLQVCEAGDAGECLVGLPSPSQHPFPTPSTSTYSEEVKALFRALENLDNPTAAKLKSIYPPSSSSYHPTSSSEAFSKPGPSKLVLERFGHYLGKTAAVTIAGAAIQKTTAPKQAANIDKRPWSRMSEAARLHAAAVYCEEVGGMAVSLNLHPDTAARWTSGTLKTEITRLFRDALNRNLDKAGFKGLPYMLQFELSPLGRLHLHGVIDTHDRNQQEIEAIKLALRQAAGRIKGKAAGRQLQLDEITDGAGWATYIGKARKQVLDKLDLKGIYVTSQSMSRLAGNHHEIARKRRLAA
jgi:hypothetical protein